MTALATAVADCVRSHVSWMTAQAAVSPHGTWHDGPLHWASSADGRTVHGLFPSETPPDVVARGIERATELGAVEVSVWSAVDVARPELETLGFDVGWRPGWMTAPSAGFDAGPVLLSRRAGLSVRARDHEAHLQPLLERGDTWRAEAHEGSRYAGRAWLHVTDDVAGFYDMTMPPLRPHACRCVRVGRARGAVACGLAALAHSVTAALSLTVVRTTRVKSERRHRRTWWLRLRP